MNELNEIKEEIYTVNLEFNEELLDLLYKYINLKTTHNIMEALKDKKYKILLEI